MDTSGSGGKQESTEGRKEVKEQIFLGVIGFSGGLVIAGGVIALMVGLGCHHPLYRDQPYGQTCADF